MLELLEGKELFLSEASDRSLCQIAAEAATETKIILEISQVESPLPLGEAATDRVLQGLARISLEEAGYDYHGITQDKAHKIIDKLSGDAEYFFYPILAQAA